MAAQMRLSSGEPSGTGAGKAGFRGYRLHIDLLHVADGAMMPGVGLNRACVRLLTKDAVMTKPVQLVDALVVCEYLAHRNGVRADEKFHRP